MRLNAIILLFLTCIVTVLTKARPQRYIHDMQYLIASKLFTRPEPNCTLLQPNPPGLSFFPIHGNNDVINTLPIGVPITPPPLIEEMELYPEIGIFGSYVDAPTLHGQYNTLLCAKNLFRSRIPEPNRVVLRKPTSLLPMRVAPCPTRKPVKLPAVKPSEVVVVPPTVPIEAPTRYSYKQVNQDGSVTTWTSFLDYNKGVQVTHGGKTVPFITDRISKIPVRLPVPILPDVSNIVIPSDKKVGRNPVIVEQSHSSYSYKQVNQDGGQIVYTGHPPSYSSGGSVIVTENGNVRSPLSGKVSVSASFPTASVVDAQKPLSLLTKTEPVNKTTVPASGYSYTQLHGGPRASAFHQAPEYFRPSPLFPSIPERNPFGPVIVSSHPGRHGSVREQEKKFSASEHPALSVQLPGRKSFSHSTQPSLVNAGTKNYAPKAEVNWRFAHPVSSEFIQVPSVQASESQGPVKPPANLDVTPFLYKYVHPDGSVTAYDGNGLLNENVNKPMTLPEKPAAQTMTRDFKSPNQPGSLPNEVNKYAFEPSTPVSGTYSYKLLNKGQVDYHFDTGANDDSKTPEDTETNSHVPSHPLGGPVVSVAPVPEQSWSQPEAIFYPDPVDFASSSHQVDPSNYSHKQTGNPHQYSFSPFTAKEPATVPSNINKEGKKTNDYLNSYHNINKDYYINPSDHVHGPSERNSEILPSIKESQLSRTPPIDVSNRFSFKNFDGYNSAANNSMEVSKQVSTPNSPVENSYSNPVFDGPAPQQSSIAKFNTSVYKAPIPVRDSSSTRRVLHHQKPVTPVNIPVKSNFMFKQSSPDGFTITTTNDGGNTLSVQVKDSPETRIMQLENLSESESEETENTPRPVDKVDSTVSTVLDGIYVDKTSEPEPETTTALLRRRKMQRVKKVKYNRGDIIDTE